MQTDKYFNSEPVDITSFDLAEFEDLYYATCAKLQELLHVVDIHLANGFKAPNDTYFMYHCPRLEIVDPIRVGDFRSSLLIYGRILYDARFVELLNHGILNKAIRDKLYNAYQQLGQGLSAISLDTRHTTGAQHNVQANPAEENHQSLGPLIDIRGLQDPRKMSCSMIYATLAEKYRSNVLSRQALGATICRETTPDVPQAHQEANYNRQYVSPYNLEERAKKLNMPGAPEMPCICDPECMCALVCASDPTQNCLCEENGLFARVTQGMDIDDLDVPDLEQRSRASSEASGNGPISPFESVQSLSVPSIDKPEFSPVNGPFLEGCLPTSLSEEQLGAQPHQLLNKLEASNITAINIHAFPEDDHYSLWVNHGMIPPRVSSLSYRDYCEVLKQPYAKLCDHPPKRISMTQRLFSSRSHSVASTNGASNRATSKTFKQGNKRSLPSMSFNSLKFSLRRD